MVPITNLIFRALLVIGLLAVSGAATCQSVCLVSSNHHYGMVHRIEAALFQEPSLSISINHILAQNISKKESIETLKECNIIVSIGAESLESLLSLKLTTPILSVLTRKSIFEQILHKNNRVLEDKQHPLCVLYLDHPLSRHLNLIDVLFPNKKPLRLGVLLGTYTLSNQNLLQNLTREKNITLTSVFVKKFENPVAIMDSILNEVDVVLALPDPRIYHSSTARGILLTAFHKRIPLIGYSHTFVNNGALAAVYSNMKQIGDETANSIIQIIKHSFDEMSKEQYPSEYSVAINYQVAKSLGLSLPDENTIKAKMKSIESKNSKVGS